MSLPIYLIPHEKEIIEELKLQGADDKTIKSITYGFKGKKRELELLRYLKDNRNNKISFKDIIDKKVELINKYDEFWGYILVYDGDCFPEWSEEYNPDKYIKQQELKKYKHLEDYEIDAIFNIDKRAKNRGENTLLQRWYCIKREFNNYDKSKEPYIDRILSTGGDIRFNPKNLVCNKCGSIYVVTHLYGDVFYRLLNGTEEQKKKEKERFAKMGLYDNPSPYGAEPDDKKYLCLGCGNEW